MNIKEDNQTIARFMGYEYFTFDPANRDINGISTVIHGWRKPNPGHHKIADWFLCRKHTELPYYNNWNQLMKVVDEIEKLGYKVTIGHDTYAGIIPPPTRMAYNSTERWESTTFVEDENGRRIEPAKTKKEGLYIAVVKFINWYNHNK